MLKLKLALITWLLLFSFNQALATAQFPDKIIYNGREYDLHTNPMEDYFKKFPDKKPKTGIVSSALWRGYVATFEVSDNQLFLKDIQIEVRKKDSDKPFETEWKSFLAEIVSGDKKMKIDWFSGILVLPVGKIVQYVHMGYASTYENYILLEIAGGDFKRAREFNYREYAKFKERQYEAFRKTDEYRKIVEDLKKNKDYTDEFIESFIKSWVISYSSKILVD
jgi:hypothetical protein